MLKWFASEASSLVVRNVCSDAAEHLIAAGKYESAQLHHHIRNRARDARDDASTGEVLGALDALIRACEVAPSEIRFRAWSIGHQFESGVLR